MELRNPREFVCYSEPRCTSSNAKTLGLKYQQFRDMGVSCEPPDRTRVVNHSSDKLFIQHNSISDGRIISPVQERCQHSQSVLLFSHLIDMNGQGQPCIKGHP